jgi:hypothetical protein
MVVYFTRHIMMDTEYSIAFNGNGTGDDTPGVIYPKLVEHISEDVVAQYKRLPNPIGCEYQGYFYDLFY